MKKKKLWVLLLVLVLLANLLAGCGQDKKQNDQENRNNQENQNDQENRNNPEDENKQNDITDNEEPDVPGITLVAEGVSEYVIVRGAAASATEVNAAENLQEYLEKISGVKLPIVTDNTDAVAKEIVVGKTNREGQNEFDRNELGEDGFIIKTADSRLWLVGGGDRGTIYSVYTFLEEYLGCRFFAEKFEKVPEMKDISIAGIKEDKQIPVFFHRNLDWNDYIGTDISVKRKLNTPIWGRELPEEVGGGVRYCKGVGGHTFFSFVDPSVYFETHPEYFSMDENGKRVSNKQLCLTNPDVLKLTIAGVRKWLSEDPGATIISVSQMDTDGPCLCENCKKIYEEEGGAYSGAVLRFVNAVAEDIADDYPNVWVDTFAYEYTRSAPAKTKPADNVLVRLCTIECCFRHPHSTDTSISKNTSYLSGGANTFAEDLEAWKEICEHVFIYDYTCNYGFWPMTFPDFSNLRENIRWYADNNTNAVNMQGNQLSSSVEFSELRAYLISKLLWNPYMSEEEYNRHMDEFLEYVYGPGGKYIRKYIELAEEETKDICINLSTGPYEMYPITFVDKNGKDVLPEELSVDMVKNYEQTDWRTYWNWYTDVEENPVTAKGRIFFGKALGLAETESQKEQINRIYLQVEFVKSFYYNSRITEAEGEMYQMIKQFIQIHSDEFTEEEKKSLPVAIAKLGEKQVYNDYRAYNYTLCERLVQEGVIYISEGISLNGWQGFDFTNIPNMWSE